MKKTTGFTLSEVLMVVVVIGILATLIIPRMADTPEKSFVQEANQYVSALIRAQRTNLAKGEGFIAVNDNTTPAPWQLLGLQPPGTSTTSGNGSKFNYRCYVDPIDGQQVCEARRPNQAQKLVKASTSGLWVTREPSWTIAPDYTLLANGGAYWVKNS